MSQDERNYNECPICLANARLPIATQCGHIFCWGCIKNWIEVKRKNECPICKNGINLEKVTKLFSGNNEVKQGEIDDRPEAERIAPQVNRPNFFQRLSNSLGLFGIENNGEERIQPIDQKEVMRNRASLIVFIIGIILVILVFKE